MKFKIDGDKVSVWLYRFYVVSWCAGYINFCFLRFFSFLTRAKIFSYDTKINLDVKKEKKLYKDSEKHDSECLRALSDIPSLPI